jgi:hypothetical protein
MRYRRLNAIPLYTPCQAARPAIARQILAQKGVEFEEKNVREDLDAMQEIARMGSQATPT